jgi:predicted transcriptional regulator
MTTTAADVRRAAGRALRAADRERDARDELYAAIILAAANGVPVTELAAAANLSVARVYQILGRPTETVRPRR